MMVSDGDIESSGRTNAAHRIGTMARTISRAFDREEVRSGIDAAVAEAWGHIWEGDNHGLAIDLTLAAPGRQALRKLHRQLSRSEVMALIKTIMRKSAASVTSSKSCVSFSEGGSTRYIQK
jgi:hypothetical protein